jgi:hypothetical protein
MSPVAPKDPAQMGVLLAHMAALGYGVVGRDDNAQTLDVGCCTELTLLRVERPGPAAGGGAPHGPAAAWRGPRRWR